MLSVASVSTKDSTTFDGVTPGLHHVCTIWIPNLSQQPDVVRRLLDNPSALPVSCNQIVVTANDSNQVFELEGGH
jgi:hypothetical protein